MKFRQLLLVLLATLSSVSCTSYRKVPYLQNSAEVNRSGISQPLYDARIMPKDLLTITVNTTDPQASIPFNLTTQTPASVTSSELIYSTSQPTLQRYLVDNSGNIDFPVLGTLHVGGLTKGEAESMIRERLMSYLKEVPVVTVRMVNYKISVLGEVSKPGTFTVSNEKINVLEALAMAGDMSIYGKRNNVLVIRENDGKMEFARLDLNTDEVFTSPYYFLQQNDVLYVEPNNVKAISGLNISLYLSAATTLASVVSVTISAIAVKR